jgi:arabinan endo-1,5-alpha-L-arabinosidase
LKSSQVPRNFTAVILPLLLAAPLLFCGGGNGAGPTSTTTTATSSPVFTNYHLVGANVPVRDPSVIRVGSNYYVFGTDTGGPVQGSVPIRCSTDRVNWTVCGSVFAQIPAWVRTQVSGILGLWAPDISFFNGLYHVYYAGSTFGSNTSVIGLATNTTLDTTDPAYLWVDQGEVLGSVSTDDFNAIDPTILVDTDGSVWLTYGSYWTGIKQRQIDPATGMLLTSNPTVYALAERPNVQFDPVEGTSLVHKDSNYYLFASFDNCCAADPFQSTYRIMVGRGTGPHGPFVDENGISMLQGGGTQLLAGNGSTWNAPGGATVCLDAQQGDTIVFHALHLPDGAPYLFVNSLTWVNGWPQIQP